MRNAAQGRHLDRRGRRARPTRLQRVAISVRVPAGAVRKYLFNREQPSGRDAIIIDGMMQRPTYVQRPRDGDYIMRFTGLTWSVLRRTGEEGAFILSTGYRDRKAALVQVRSLTERDHANGWEPDGPDFFRQVTRFRT